MTSDTKKNRSPVHPVIDLEQAIARARELCDAEGFNYVPVHVAVSHWGYGPKSSSGLRTLAALIHFGLAEDTGVGRERRVRLTDLAKQALRAQREGDEHAFREALKEAALHPTIYRKLWNVWGQSNRLPSKSSMEWDLIHEFEFNPKAVDSFIKDFVATMQFAGLYGEQGEVSVDPREASSASAREVPGDRDDKEAESLVPMRGRGPAPSEVQPVRSNAGGIVDRLLSIRAELSAQSTRVETITIPLPGGIIVALTTPLPLSQSNYSKLKAWFEWAEDSLTAPAPEAESREAMSDRVAAS